jgi:hypothetical protein
VALEWAARGTLDPELEVAKSTLKPLATLYPTYEY